MKARFSLLALAALSFAACNIITTPPVPEVVPNLTVSGAKDNTISVTADAKTVNLTVKANVAWSVTCDADWLTVDPQSADNAENKDITTKVSVVVDANEAEEARTATLTVKAEGVEDVVITVNQAGAVAESNLISVWDMTNWEAVEDPAVELSFDGSAVELVINAAGDWTASCPDWITLDPASNTFDGENENVTVSVSASLAEEARSGEITFSGDFDNTLVVKVCQKSSVTFSFEDIEVEHAYCDATVKITPSDAEVYWRPVYSTKGTETDVAVNFILNQLNQFLAKYEPSVIFENLAYQGEQTLEYTELDAATDFTVFAVAIEYNAVAKAFVAASLPATHDFSTVAAPVASEGYTALIGTYTCDVYDYFGETRMNLTMVVDPLYVNESYNIYFPDDVLSPVDGNYVDKFPAVYDEQTKSLCILSGYIGSEGATWNYGDLGYCAIAFRMFWDSEAEDIPNIEYLPYVLSEDGNSLVLSAEVPVADAVLCYQGLIVDESYQSTGYSNGLVMFDESTSFNRVPESSALSVKSKVFEPLNFKKNSEKINTYFPASF